VMLVLLVVFIVTAPLLTQSVKVNLPKTVATSPSLQDHLATVSIDAAGEVFLNTERVALDVLGPRLAEMLARDAELAVQLNADDKVNYGRVAEAMAVVQKAGIAKLSFQTRLQSE
jgi:biopolymer transport protein TolR